MKYFMLTVGVVLAIVMLLDLLDYRELTKSENRIYWIVFGLYMLLTAYRQQRNKALSR
jgi:hypothetical protein